VTLSNATIEADGMEIADNGKTISFIGRVRTVVDNSGKRGGTALVASGSPPPLAAERAAAASPPEPER